MRAPDREAAWVTQPLRRALDRAIVELRRTIMRGGAARYPAERVLLLQQELTRQGVRLDTATQATIRRYTAAAARYADAGAGTILGQLQDATGTPTPYAALPTTVASASIRATHSRIQAAVGTTRTHLTQAATQALADATSAAGAGAITWRQAAREAMAGLTRSGVTALVDSAGRRWALDTWSQMAVRTGLLEAQRDAQLAQMRALGLDLVTVPHHGHPCPLCSPWEGTVLRTDDGPDGPLTVTRTTPAGDTVQVRTAGTIAEARRAGLMHPNCAHTWSAWTG